MTRVHRILLCTALLPGIAVHADVTIEQTMRIDGVGLMKVMNMTANSKAAISGSRARTDTDLRMDSGLVRMFTGGPKAEIVLLDADVQYLLDLKKKRYTQTTLTEQRAKLEQAMAQMREAQVAQRQTTSGVDESQCDWSTPTANTSRVPGTVTIAGFPAEQAIVTATQSCTNRTNPAQVCQFRLTVDEWLTPDYPGGQEALDYYRSYAETLGLSVSGTAEFAQRAQALFGGYQGIWNEVLARTRELQGFPLKSTISLSIGGPQCARNDAATVAQPEAPSATEVAGQAVGGAIGGAIGGLFGKKKPPDAAPPVQQPLPGDMVPILTVSSETLSVSNAALGPQTFEVPAKFKKSG